MGKLRQTTEEIQSLLDKIESGEVGSPDWSANEGEKGYIKNRTHYDIRKSDAIANYEMVDDYWDDDGTDIKLIKLSSEIEQIELHLQPNSYEVGEEAKEYFYRKGDKEKIFSANNPDYDDYGFIRTVENRIEIGGTTFGVYTPEYTPGDEGTYGLIVEIAEKKLDEKYIPDSIARVSDVESANKATAEALEKKTDKGVLDWREDDEKRAGYVKGKTHFINDSALNECSLDANDYEVVYSEMYEEVVDHIVYKDSLSPWDDFVIVTYYVSLIDTGSMLLNSETKTATYLSDKYQVINPEGEWCSEVVAKIEDIYDDYGDIQERELHLRLANNDAYSAGEILGNFKKIKLGYAYDLGIKKLDEKFVPHTIARQESVDELREETTALWENIEHGTFPDLVAGDLAGHGESVPAEFTFRASGGKSIKDGRAYIKAIKGNSVVWNNMVDSRGYDGGFFVDVPPPIIQGHKYLLKRTHATNGLYLIPIINGEEKYEMSIQNGVYAAILESPHTGDTSRVYSESYSGACVISDLTKMFGAGNEPSTIEEYEARKPIVEDEFAYNEGEVIAFNGDAVKSVGDNAFDDSRDNFITDYDYNTPGDYSFMNEQDVYVGATRNGYAYWYNVEDYSKSGNGYSFRPTGGGYGLGMMVKALPNEEYSITWKSDNGQVSIGFYDSNKKVIDHIANTNTFVTPSNCEYILLVLCALDNHIGEQVVINDIMLTLVHSGWKVDTDAGYQPYWQDTLPLSIISKYFPDGMQSAGSAHDEIRFNKATNKWEAVQRIGSVDLGTLEWSEGIYNGYSAFYSPDNALNGLWADHIFYLCAKYQPAQYRIYTQGLDKSIAFNNGYYGASSRKDEIVIRDTSHTDVESFKASLQGVILYYELAEPIVTEITEDFRDYYKVADFGTEQAQSAAPSAAFSADIIYQFNAVDMIREHELEITELQKVIATMQAQLASLTNN